MYKLGLRCTDRIEKQLIYDSKGRCHGKILHTDPMQVGNNPLYKAEICSPQASHSASLISQESVQYSGCHA